jgi:predicted transcriptional regulator
MGLESTSISQCMTKNVKKKKLIGIVTNKDIFKIIINNKVY